MQMKEFNKLSKELLNQTSGLEKEYIRIALKIIRNDFKEKIKQYSPNESALEEMIFADLCGALAYYDELGDIEEAQECSLNEYRINMFGCDFKPIIDEEKEEIIFNINEELITSLFEEEYFVKTTAEFRFDSIRGVFTQEPTITIVAEATLIGEDLDDFIAEKCNNGGAYGFYLYKIHKILEIIK